MEVNKLINFKNYSTSALTSGEGWGVKLESGDDRNF